MGVLISVMGKNVIAQRNNPYQNYVNSRYGKGAIFFDRYLPAPAIYKQRRRLRKSTIAPKFLVELENIFSEVSQKAFLSSSYNKKIH